MHCNARQVLRKLFSTNQENGSDIINYIVMEDLNVWQILAEVLLELVN